MMLKLFMQSLPTQSSELSNRNAKALINFFRKSKKILYLYGPTGCGKTFSIEMLSKEHGYENIEVYPPVTIRTVLALTAGNLFGIKKRLVIVDNIKFLSNEELKFLAEGDWINSRLIMIGNEYPRSSPIRRIFKDNENGFEAIKFYPFDKDEILTSLSLYAIEFGYQISYDILKEISDSSDGDMRSARMSLRNMIYSESEEGYRRFLSPSEDNYYNNINRLFSGVEKDVTEAINSFGEWYTLMLVRENVIEFIEDEEKLQTYIDLINIYSDLSVEWNSEIINLCMMLSKDLKTFRYKFFSKPSTLVPRDIEDDCSVIKKILYFGGT